MCQILTYDTEVTKKKKTSIASFPALFADASGHCLCLWAQFGLLANYRSDTVVSSGSRSALPPRLSVSERTLPMY